MGDFDQSGQSGPHTKPGPRVVPGPMPHAGIRNALHTSFASPPNLPGQWVRLLDQLGVSGRD